MVHVFCFLTTKYYNGDDKPKKGQNTSHLDPTITAIRG